MNRFTKPSSLILLSLMLIHSLAYGSGSGGFGGGGSFGSSKPSDPVYDQGKALYKGRIKDYGKVKYCLVSASAETGSVRIKSKTIKPYKDGELQKLADDLRFCTKVDKKGNKTGGEKVAGVLTNDHLMFLLYYLNKRYRLGFE